MYLDSGPGPTVARAFSKDQTPYFATVIQCSLLSSVFDKRSLSGAIKQYFEKQAECTPAKEIPIAGPSEEGIFGFLQACEEQSSSYNWVNQLTAIGRTLHCKDHEIHRPIPVCILRGLIDMLPLVQHFPEDRIIEIENGDGVCFLIAWAHLVLGLCVTVIRTSHISGTRSYQEPKTFGSGSPQVIIRVGVVRRISSVFSTNVKPSITLLAAAADGKNEKLFRLEPDPDESQLEAVFRRPAKGYGKGRFEMLWDHEDGRESFLEEMSLITSGYAFALSKNLYKATSRQRCSVESPQGTSASESSENENSANHDVSKSRATPYAYGAFPLFRAAHDTNEGRDIPYKIDTYPLLNAAQFLFNDRKLSKQSISQYATRYSCVNLNHLPRSSERIYIILNCAFGSESAKGKWCKLASAVRELSTLLLAFAHVRDLKSCEDLLLSDDICGDIAIQEISLVRDNLTQWDGRQPVFVTEFQWFDTLAALMLHNFDLDYGGSQPSLQSDRGWSIYLSTLSNTDPSFTDVGLIVIRKGVPCRNNVRKHAIFDSTDSVSFGPGGLRVENKAGEQATLCCMDAIEFGSPLCGERKDSFIVSLRIHDIRNGTQHTWRTGYSDLYEALWAVQKTTSCQHPPLQNKRLTLDARSVTVSGHVADGDLGMDDRLIICLTAYNTAARWRALCSAINYELTDRRVLLRGSDCCFACTIAQTAVSTERWWIIL